MSTDAVSRLLREAEPAEEWREFLELCDFFEKLPDKWRKERAETQMTLGKLIDQLEQLPVDMEVDGLCKPASYRGYYEDLAFERCGRMPVSQLFATCKTCVGKTLYGYKGGKFRMDLDTPLWVASWGMRGDRIMSLDENGVIHTEPQEP